MKDAKKYIYLAIIAVCIGVMVWAFLTLSKGGSTSSENTAQNPSLTSGSDTTHTPNAAQTQDISQKEYFAPKVFPDVKGYENKVLDNKPPSSLNPYVKASVTPEELNKEDLFAPY